MSHTRTIVSPSLGTVLLVAVTMFLWGAITIGMHLHAKQESEQRRPGVLRRIGEAGSNDSEVKSANLGEVNTDALTEPKEGLFARIRANSLQRRSVRWRGLATSAQRRSSQLQQRCYQVRSSRGTCFTGGGQPARVTPKPSNPYCPTPYCPAPDQTPPKRPGPNDPLDVSPLDPLNKPKPDLRPSEGIHTPVSGDELRLSMLPEYIKNPATSRFGDVNPNAALEGKQEEDAKEQMVDAWPADDEKEIITFFSHSDWSKYPDEVRLVDCLRSDEFREFKEPRMFKHITNTDILYRERFAGHVPEVVFPALMIQWPNGGTYYTVCKSNIPQSGKDLVDAIEIARSLDPSLGESAQPPTLGLADFEQRLQPDLSLEPFPADGDVPDEFNLNPFQIDPELDPLKEMRIRDAFGRMLFMVGLVFCLGVMLIILPIALIIFYIIRPRN